MDDDLVRENFGDVLSPEPHYVDNLYPFDDNKFRRSGDVKSHLDDLAKRHPEFASHLRCPPWGGESSGMNKPPSTSSSNTDWEHAYTIPVKIETSNDTFSSTTTPTKTGGQNEAKSKSNANETGLDRHGLRNTVDIGEQVLKNAKQENETQKRAFSAPPSNGNCVPKEQDKQQKRFTSKIEITPVNPYDPSSSSSGGNTDGISGSKTNPNTTDKKLNVRHIPIFVEGRKDPVYPKSAGDVHNESNDQSPLKRKLDSASASKHQVDTAEPPKPIPKKPNPLHQIEEIQKEVDVLAAKVDQFAGNSRSDKQYLYLDEMLTRNLIKLDVIEINGNEDIRSARKNAIKCIQKCISVLESKVPNVNPEEVLSNDVDMEDKTKDTSQSEDVGMETNEDLSEVKNHDVNTSISQINTDPGTTNNEVPVEILHEQCQAESETHNRDNSSKKIESATDQNNSSETTTNNDIMQQEQSVKCN